ncbi:hypothetical protein I3760_15G108400 [Carya illinoinensis]|nr:hypothetical protein I3760_15G108400 [Carya illinoinensis]
MLVTYRGTLYVMEKNQNLNNQHTEQPNLQQQINQIATTLEQLTNRLDAMDELQAREKFRPFNQRGRVPIRVEVLDESDRDVDKDWEDEEDQEFEDLRPRHGGHNAEYQPLDELTKTIKVDVPDFYGKLEPNAFEDWLTAIKDYFDWFAVSGDQKVCYVWMKLKGQARAWWESVEEQLRHTRRPAISNWGKMKERLKEKYLPIDYEQMMFEEMLQLRQGSLSVDQFTDCFHELTVHSKIVETEHQTLAGYCTRLRSDLLKEMLTTRLINAKEAYQLALCIEKQMGVSATIAEKSTWAAMIEDQKGKVKDTSKRPQCYKCKGFECYVVVCPTRDKKLAFICEKELLVMDVVEEMDEEKTDGDSHNEEHLGASNLPILNVFTDNGSGMNVISEIAVECLGLKIEKYPTPYQISWFNEDNSVLVKQRCLVKFSLGKKICGRGLVRCDPYDRLSHAIRASMAL